MYTSNWYTAQEIVLMESHLEDDKKIEDGPYKKICGISE